MLKTLVEFKKSILIHQPGFFLVSSFRLFCLWGRQNRHDSACFFSPAEEMNKFDEMMAFLAARVPWRMDCY